ncbi:hypothetical protein BCR33DRAFT_369716 [Rhizoclosmatium globosum]|uniref:Uncharacterized protein n=1 Tax=Rhizoclosmatium globosum TaxID=329046 RepID=A0A1Y2BZE8_9FUNG|nr:hypothetical protein BCR33DRAFT_369716 [Rhizoclosmatium globosum]|eukprot:ORY40106.1 hypothetical protein BCR33DRAFT_369716 [Rhizoclosmatium globosum]
MGYNLLLFISPHQAVFPISFDRVKIPGQVYDPYPIFVEMTSLCIRFKLWNLIGTSKLGSLHQQVWNRFINCSDKTFASSAENTPRYSTRIHLSFENPKGMSDFEIIHLAAHVMKMRHLFVTHLFCLRLQCLRPIVHYDVGYVAVVPTNVLDNQTQSLIINAINVCMEAAWRTLSIFCFANHVTEIGEREWQLTDKDLQLFDLQNCQHRGLKPLFVFGS